MAAHVGQQAVLGLGEVDRALAHCVGEARGGMHVPHDRNHRVQRLPGRAEHEVDPVVKDSQFRVRDQAGHLKKPILGQVQPGHLAVDPHEPVHGPTLR